MNAYVLLHCRLLIHNTVSVILQVNSILLKLHIYDIVAEN